MNLSKLEQIRVSGDLPSPKGVALAIVRLTQRDDASLADLAHTVKADPAFVGRLIKAANGVIFGRGRSIASIQDSIQVLGVPAVRSLALGFSLVSSYRAGKCKNFDYLRFWSHSLLNAIAFQAIMVKTRLAPADEAFSVGLLARIGELALATLFPEQYSTVLEKAKADVESNVSELEMQTFAMTHSELTAAMLMDWGLPRLFTDAVGVHEQPDFDRYSEGSRQLQMLHALILARHIADICVAPEAMRRDMLPRLYALGSSLAIETDALTAICDRVAVDWVEWGAMLNLASLVLPSFEEMAQLPTLGEDGGGGAEPSKSKLQTLRILIVDDDPIIRAMLREQLEEFGHEVFEAEDGQQGLEMALELRPHILIADWLMPKLDGLALTSTLRQTRPGRACYIMLLTVKEDDETLITAFDAGVDDFMSKPLRAKVLAARLRAAHRVVSMQQEIERDSAEISRIATELAISNRRLEEVAMTDYLTRFPNRRYAMDRIRKEWSAAQRSGRPLSCMVMDVDNFKQVNDEYGHDVGDTMLKLVADTMRGSFRGLDAVCRVGGDEFLVICPDTPLEAALLCAERARKAVENLVLDIGATKIKAGLSIGVAIRDVSMANADAMIKRADEGLYVAKRRGRNCVAALQAVS